MSAGGSGLFGPSPMARPGVASQPSPAEKYRAQCLVGDELCFLMERVVSAWQRVAREEVGRPWRRRRLRGRSSAVQCCGLSVRGKRQRSLVEGDVDVGGGNVALVPIGAPHASPAVALVLFHHRQHLTLLHGNGAFAGPCGVHQQ